MKKVRHVSLTRRTFLRKSAAAAFGLLATACVAAPGPATQPSGSVSAPASTTAPAVVRPSVAKNDFEAKYEELGRQLGRNYAARPGGRFRTLESQRASFTEIHRAHGHKNYLGGQPPMSRFMTRPFWIWPRNRAPTTF